MKMVEYGKENEKVSLFLHGGGLSWWSFRTIAEKLQSEYHVVLPILDGHAGSDGPFISIEENAKQLVAYISERWNGKVFLLGGLSLGAQIALEMLSQQADICDYAIIESALIKPMEITSRFIGSSFSISYPLIKKRWFAKMQFKELKLPPELFDEYYRDSCRIQKSDMIAFLKANTSYQPKKELSKVKAKTLILAGGKEQNKILESAEELAETIPENDCVIFPALFHGQASIQCTNQYIDVLKAYMQ